MAIDRGPVGARRLDGGGWLAGLGTKGCSPWLLTGAPLGPRLLDGGVGSQGWVPRAEAHGY